MDISFLNGRTMPAASASGLPLSGISNRTRLAAFATGLALLATLLPNALSSAVKQVETALSGALPIGGRTESPEVSTPRVPVHFEKNQGQTDPSVEFSARLGASRLFLTKSEAVLSLSDGKKSRVVRMRPENANPSPVIEGLKPQAATVNYLVGDDPKGWTEDVKTYSRAAYREIYPGIDLVFYGASGGFEYDFVVAPWADPSQIETSFSGVSALRLDKGGDLILDLGKELETIKHKRPVAFQGAGSERTTVKAGYRLEGNEVRFELGSYDSSKQLTIDPLVFSTYLGGTDSDSVRDVAADATGIYATGQSRSTNFPTQSGYQGSLAGGDDVILTKFTPSGNALIYSTFIGGTSGDIAEALEVDSLGNAFIVGRTGSRDYPSTSGSFDADRVFSDGVGNGTTTFTSATANFVSLDVNRQITGPDFAANTTISSVVDATTVTLNTAPLTNASGLTFTIQGGHNLDHFVTKVNSAGNGLAYSTYLGGSVSFAGHPSVQLDVAIDSSGNAYVTGGTSSANFPTTAGAYQTAFSGTPSSTTGDAYVVKLNPSGSGLIYSTFYGGTGMERAYTVAVDGLGRAYIGGITQSSNLPTVSAIDTSLGGTLDDFVARFSADGSALEYSTYLGGSNVEGLNVSGPVKMVVDSSYNAYVFGRTQSSDFPVTAGVFQPVLAGSAYDGFLTKFSPAGSLVFSTFLGGSSSSENIGTRSGLVLDSQNNIYLAGGTSSDDYPTASPVRVDTAGNDYYITKLNAAGTGLIWSTYLGGSGNDFSYTPLALDLSGNLIFGGGGASSDLLIGGTSLYPNSAGGTMEGYVAKFTPWPKYRSGDYNADGRSDVGVYRAGTGVWYVNDQFETSWGGDPSDLAVPGDYNADGFADLAVYRAATGAWYVKDQFETSWGGDPSDIPAPGDYDADGDTDLAVYRSATGTWYINLNEGGPNDIQIYQWGGDPSDKPSPGDYDADGDTDIALYRQGTGYWYVYGQPSLEAQWGGDGTDKAVPGDYDGDGDWDFAVYRASTGYWYVKDQPGLEGPWGGDGSDLPVPGDFNRDGKNDIAVYRKDTGYWYVKDQLEVSWGGDSTDQVLVGD